MPKAAGQVAKVKKTILKKTLPTMRFDGRSERIQKSIKHDSQKASDELTAIKFDETFDGLLLTGEALKEFQQALSKKLQLIALQKKLLTACLAKIDRSSAKELYTEEKGELDALAAQAKAMQTFIDFTRNPTDVDWIAYHESFQQIMKRHELSKPYVLRALDAAHRAALLFSDDDAVCDTMKAESKLGVALHLVVSGEELVSVLTAKTDAIILTPLTAYAKDKRWQQKGCA